MRMDGWMRIHNGILGFGKSESIFYVDPQIHHQPGQIGPINNADVSPPIFCWLVPVLLVLESR
jgi:hypothetical protein